ncbi:MAG: SagB/ThcOx family dehydrogenase [bacterium]
MKKIMRKSGLTFVIVAAVAAFAAAQELKDIALPKPKMDGGVPLMQALKGRKSARSFSAKNLPMQVVSNLLWAAMGINRPDGKKTAPSAVNWQEISIYAVFEDGAYSYDAKSNSLKAILKGDIRKASGRQTFVGTAPLNLVFVADYSKMGTRSGEDKDFYSAADTGFVSQNVYLYCASEGLATVVRGSIDRDALAKALKLSKDVKVILAQTVGYPEETD